MRFFKRIVLSISLFFICFYAQAQDTLKLSRAECEVMFLKENLWLLANKLEISQAEALVLQAKLWPNPQLGIDEVNLWATQKQLDVFGDELRGFNNGSFGKNQQLSLSLEQLLLTAGKRKKLVSLEKINVEKSVQYFEDVLRSLKRELRSQLTQIQYLQFNKLIYQEQLAAINKLTDTYKKQVALGNVAKDEYIRLKALELQMAKELKEVNKEINDAQKELKILLHLPASVFLEISDAEFLMNIKKNDLPSLNDLLLRAQENRPDYKLAQLDQKYSDKYYSYEKAQKVPDLTLKAGYDRGGNIFYNFVGFGIAMDLPVFNRNQGNIQFAKIGIEKSKIGFKQVESTMENEITALYQDLLNALSFFDLIEPDYERTLDELFKNYTKNFMNRNVSILEYLDFIEAYLENKKIILDAGKEMNDLMEDMNYTLGKDLIRKK